MPNFLNQVKQTVTAKKTSSAPFATWYDEKGKQVDEYTFQKLWNEAGNVAYSLRNEWNVQKGDLIVLCYDFGIHFFAAFLGCLRAGVTAVIVYPPSPPLVKSLAKMNKVIDDCSPVLILTDSKVNLFRKTDISNPFSKSRHLWPSNVQFKVTTNIPKSMQEKLQFDEPNISPSDLAFLQYTSGSTGNPKGVMVTHSALNANIQILADSHNDKCRREGKSPDNAVGFSWLPQYHDMGLIGFFILPFAAGWRMHMMSPLSFIKNPLLWIDLMSQHKVHFSGGPDFAYQLVARKFKEALKSKKKHPVPNLDLSNIQYLTNAAEPIKLDTRDLIHKTFQKYGLGGNWFTTSYGLAESVVGVCWLNDYVTEYETNVKNGEKQRSQYPVIAVGDKTLFHPSVTVKIVDPETCIEASDGQSGEIWVSGPSITAGYFGKPELTKQTFQAQIACPESSFSIHKNNYKQEMEENKSKYNDHDDVVVDNNKVISCSDNQYYLRTGDKGFFADNRLYICGRYKDLIIVNGVNYYPHDIENVTQQASPLAVRPGCCAAFSSLDHAGEGNEQLVVVFEIRANKYKEAKQVCLEIQSAISTHIGLIATVVAVKERTICKTTSGKIQRTQNRIHFQVGKLQAVYHSSNQATKTSTDKENNEGSDASEPETFDSFLQGMFGETVDENQSWIDLGLSSIQSVELSNFASNKEGVQLPPNFMDLYPTIAELKHFMASSQGKPIDTSLPDLDRGGDKEMSWWSLSVYQSFGLLMLLVMVTTPMIPAVHVARVVDWYLLPFIFPVWMSGYTTLLIIVKWIVIGRYKEQEILVPSHAFVRWWFVDRAVFVWNGWVGRFVQDSPLQWLTYALLGAKIHPSAKIDTFLQEFDLIQVDKDATVTSPIRCSKFGNRTNEKESEKVLRFRPVTIQANCEVDGHLSPGVVVGEGAVVETYAMVADGGQISERSIVCGNPAYQFESTIKSTTKKDSQDKDEPSSDTKWQLDILKLVSYLVFLYLSFGCMGLGAFIVRDGAVTNWEWRYAPLFLMILSVFVGIVISVLLNIVLKWILIGKRRPGPYKQTLYTEFTEWFVDYHFAISSCFLGDLISYSRFWNLIMKLYGMDVDWVSRFVLYNYPPSKVDLISIKNTFASAALYKVKKDGQYFQTKLNESSIGWYAHVAPDVEVTRGILHPLSVAKRDVIRNGKDDRAQSISILQYITNWIVTDVTYLVLYCLLALATIPTYELCLSYFYDLSSGMIIPVASALIIIQSCMMFLVWNLVQCATYVNKKQSEPWNASLFQVLITVNWFMQRYTVLPLTCGTFYFNIIARFLGSSLLGKGRVLFWGVGYDFPFFTFDDDTIVDYGTLSGHHVVHQKITLGRLHVSGILHPVTYVMPNVEITEKESGPWVALVSNTTPVSEHNVDNAV